MSAVIGFTLLAFLKIVSSNPTVHSPWGTIEGTTNFTEDYTSYHAFKGIPFAVPPVGSRRFTKPESHPGFNHTFQAYSYGPSCLQSLKLQSMPGTDGDEDCLTLNVFTPALHTETSGIPVMVWIHGGGYVLGNAWAFDPSPIVAKGGVIFVTIQYRLGAFGFLSTGDSTSLGNYGLWDQHLAIQWVKTNIHAFGGDINKITIIGESAGSSSVAYQALYPGSRGLFQRTIMQSGSASSSWAHKRNPTKYNSVLARKVSCPPTNDAAMVSCLRNVPAKTLTEASYPLGTSPLSLLSEYYFVPTVDGGFVMKDPLSLINNNTYLREVGLQDLDSMVAMVSNEGGNTPYSAKIADSMYNSSLSTYLNQTSFFNHKLIPYFLKLYFGHSNAAMARSVSPVYLPAHFHDKEVNAQVLMDLAADPEINVPTTVFARAHSHVVAATRTGKKTFLYEFDHVPSFLPRTSAGMTHGEDLMYTFGLTNAMMKFLRVPKSPAKLESVLSDNLISILTEFARNGDPNSAVKHFLTGGWPTFSQKNESYLHLDTQMSVKTHPFQQRMRLWTVTLPHLLHQHHGHVTHVHQTRKASVIG